MVWDIQNGKRLPKGANRPFLISEKIKVLEKDQLKLENDQFEVFRSMRE